MQLSPRITFIPGSTVKLEQLIGDVDKERRVPTRSQTVARYGILGTDLGSSFEHDGRAFFLFGDTVGKLDRARDTVATTDVVDPEAGVRLDFLRNGDDYATIEPPGVSMGPFEVPLAGIDVGGRAYVVVRTDHDSDFDTDKAVLTRFTPPATFVPIRKISRRFITLSMHAEEGAPTPGLPAGGPYLLVWGTARYRKSDAFLFVVPAASLESGAGTLYFVGYDRGGNPIWSSKESDAAPIVYDGQLGDVSVTWCASLRVWLMTYDHREPRGIFFRYAKTPWGPWSEPQRVLAPPDFWKFIHIPDRSPDDGLGGPKIGRSDPHATRGGAYAPYVVERWTKAQAAELTLYYTLSTWNPYVVVLMKSRFAVADVLPPAPSPAPSPAQSARSSQTRTSPGSSPGST